jgi:RNA polymerase sigma factor (sigma-70 family)
MELLQLIRECKQQGITAQKYLYDLFAVQMFLVCRRYLKSDAEAEEMVQNGFLKIFKGLTGFSYTTDAAFVAWMKKIMINECLQELRKKNSFFMVAEENGVETISGDDVISKLSADEIYRLITQMPIGYRTVFNLYVIEGYSHVEIASILNISEGTSKSQLNRARKILQQSVTQNHLYAERKAK